MRFATIEQAGPWVAAGSGLCWPDDREAIVDRINLIRNEFYTMPSVHWKVPLCLPLKCFHLSCDPNCKRVAYRGFNLPAGFVNVLGVWQGARPMPTIDRFAVYPYDSEWENCDLYVTRDMGDGFVFEIDPETSGKCFGLEFLAENRGDDGGVVNIRHWTPEGRERDMEVTLKDEWCAPMENQIAAILPNGITLPANLKGQVSVRHAETGTILARYRPWEHVPNYHRFAVQGPCGGQVSAIAERDGSPLYDDRDVLETGNRLIWEDAARWLHLHKKTNSDGTDVANEAKFYEKFKASLEEEHRSRRGKAKRHAMRFNSLTSRQSRLYRARR